LHLIQSLLKFVCILFLHAAVGSGLLKKDWDVEKGNPANRTGSAQCKSEELWHTTGKLQSKFGWWVWPSLSLTFIQSF